MNQVCQKCCAEKHITEFEHQKNRPNPRKVCKLCRYTLRDKRKENEVAKERKKKWTLENRDHIRRRLEKAMYGTTKEEIGRSCCDICGSTKRLCIDHCHTTSEVRGILCTLCNTGLGMFKDNTENMIKAVLYLKKGPHFQLSKAKYG